MSDCLNVDVCAHCVTIESELKKECYEMLLQQYHNLKKHCISLEVNNQLKKEIFQKNTLSYSESALTFTEFFEINELKAQAQAKDTVILQLKEKLSSLKGDVTKRSVKREVEEIETLNIELDHKEKVLVITALKEQLSKLKGKAVLTGAVSLNPIDHKLLKVDVAPLVPKLRKNRTAHTDYIRHTLDEAATLREIVESERLQSPLNSSLDYAPALHDMTPGTISLGLVYTSSSPTSYVPPSRNDWDLLFQPIFDELLNPPLSVVNQAAEVIAPIAEVIPQVDADSIGSPSSTIVDQDAPSPSKYLTPTEIQSSIILQDVGNDNLDMEVAHMGNNSLLGVPILEVTSDQSSLTASPQSNVQPNHPMTHHNSKAKL
nr:hypothetical protein [Tanacetum cinerariifolium]